MKDDRIKISPGSLPDELVTKIFGGGWNTPEIESEKYIQRFKRSSADRAEYRSKLYKCECGGTLIIQINTEGWKLLRCKKCEAEWDFRPTEWSLKKR